MYLVTMIDAITKVGSPCTEDDGEPQYRGQLRSVSYED